MSNNKFVFSWKVKLPLFVLLFIGLVMVINNSLRFDRHKYEVIGNFIYPNPVKYSANKYLDSSFSELSNLGLDFSDCVDKEKFRECSIESSVISKVQFVNNRSYALIYSLPWPNQNIPGEILNVLRFDAQDADRIDEGKMFWFHINGIDLIELENIGQDPDWKNHDILEIRVFNKSTDI